MFSHAFDSEMPAVKKRPGSNVKDRRFSAA